MEDMDGEGEERRREEKKEEDRRGEEKWLAGGGGVVKWRRAVGRRDVALAVASILSIMTSRPPARASDTAPSHPSELATISSPKRRLSPLFS